MARRHTDQHPLSSGPDLGDGPRGPHRPRGSAREEHHRRPRARALGVLALALEVTSRSQDR